MRIGKVKYSWSSLVINSGRRDFLNKVASIFPLQMHVSLLQKLSAIIKGILIVVACLKKQSRRRFFLFNHVPKQKSLSEPDYLFTLQDQHLDSAQIWNHVYKTRLSKHRFCTPCH